MPILKKCVGDTMRKFSGNKGEWSESYVFFKLLADKRLYGADGDTNVLSEIYYDILSIYRYEEDGRYDYSPKDTNKIRVSLNNEKIIELPSKLFLEQAEIILRKIKQHKRGSIEIPEVEHFSKSIYLKGISAASNEKADIHMKTYDYRTGFEPELSFSIKSQLGSSSTLLNASRSTNFRYKLKGSINDDFIEKFNVEKIFYNKFDLLRKNSVTLLFDRVLSETFNDNLILIDSELPDIIATYLEQSFYLKENKIKELTPHISRMNPLKSEHRKLDLYYSYKWMEFLTNAALGVLPNTPWDGNYEATGGYIIVKEDGDIVCYHIYNRNEFREYLYKNIRFENGSTSRHDFGKIYEIDGEYFLNLNLQLRFLV